MNRSREHPDFVIPNAERPDQLRPTKRLPSLNDVIQTVDTQTQQKAVSIPFSTPQQNRVIPSTEDVGVTQS
ncbi:MAG: hypothetical protein ACF8CQ_20065 [Rhodopirellula sp. JB044]|uniref:hypothetical protein n=1 Tax=Rhodopirellula sp. JB044 TaxID=3342844 RepID=UPI00370BE610